MSYSSDGDPRVTRVETAIHDLVEALEGTGDPMFCKVNPTAIRWLNEALTPLNLKVVPRELISMTTNDTAGFAIRVFAVCQTCAGTKRVLHETPRPGGFPAYNEGPCPTCCK